MVNVKNNRVRSNVWMDIHEKAAARCIGEDVEHLAERHFVGAVGKLTQTESVRTVIMQ